VKPERLGRSLTWLLAILIAGQLAAAVFLPKSVSWDPSFGMLAAQHYVHGRTSDLLHIAEADRANLTQDRPVERGYWAPGYQVIPWLFRADTFSWGTALKATIALGLLTGLAGWALYFRSVLGSKGLAAVLLFAVVGARYVWHYAVIYAGGDLLLWVAAPWVVLANARALRNGASRWLAFAAGAFAGLAFLLKYSALFLVAGLMLVWLGYGLRRRLPFARVVAWGSGAGLVLAICKLLGFPAQGHAAAVAAQWKPLEALSSLGWAATGATDLEAVLIKACTMAGLASNGWRVALIGLSATIFLLIALWCVRRERALLSNEPGDPLAAHLGVVLALTDIACLAAVIFLGGNIAAQARLGRIAGLLLLPVVVAALWPALSSVRLGRRWLAGAALALLLVVPAVFGISAGVPRFLAVWKDRAISTGPDGIWCLGLSPGVSQPAFFAELESRLPSKDTVLFTPYAELAFPLPQRRCIVFDAAMVLSADRLKDEKWPGIPTGGVALILPRDYADDPRLPVLKAAFTDLHDWQSVPLETDPKWALWVAAK